MVLQTRGNNIRFGYTRTNSTNLIYIKEENQYVPYMVLSDNYYGNTLLVRRDVIDEQRRLNDYSSYYKDSEMDRFLNDEYLKRLPEIEPYIVSSNIVITRDDALGLSKTETETISRRFFLLCLANWVSMIRPIWLLKEKH